MLIGLGFTFFSGATEAWLVDALQATGFEGAIETVFGRGQIVSGQPCWWARSVAGSSGRSIWESSMPCARCSYSR